MAKVHLVNNARINAKRTKVRTPNHFEAGLPMEGLSILVLPRIHETSLDAKYGNQQEKANTNG